jgi:hypothetical protein
VLMPSSEEEYSNSDDSYGDGYYDESDDDITRKVFGKGGDANERANTTYCAICAGKHSEINCPNKGYSRSA